MKVATFFAVILVFGTSAVYSAKMAPTPSKSAKASPSPDCFPANAKVQLENGAFVSMDELKVGDRVAVGNGRFSDVFLFTHMDKYARRTFRRINTDAGRSITVSDGHYLRIGNELKAAVTIDVGDQLLLENGSKTTVASVHEVNDVGLFNPQTVHGDIVVGGIVASTYTTAVDAKIAHSALAPLRLVAMRVGSVIKFHNDVAAFVASVLGIAGDFVVAA